MTLQRKDLNVASITERLFKSIHLQPNAMKVLYANGIQQGGGRRKKDNRREKEY